jgi:nicotinamidase-related amidase
VKDAIGPGALHIAVDLQRLFAETTEWHTPALDAIVPTVARIAAAQPERTVFTRFITPAAPQHAAGVWQRYYQRWRSVTLERMDPALLELVMPLRRFAPPATVIDKTTYSAFESEAFLRLLERRQADTLIFTGIETDVCVLTSVMAAVDRGLRVIVVADAVASSSAAGHRAVLDAVLPRFDQQIEVIDSTDLLAAWTTAYWPS